MEEGGAETEHKAHGGKELIERGVIEKAAEDALLDEEKAGGEDFGVVALVDVGGVLAVDVKGGESWVEKSVETAEGGDAGVEGEAVGAGFAEELDDAGVGVFGTEVDHEGLVGRGEVMEDRFCFHIGGMIGEGVGQIRSHPPKYFGIFFGNALEK